ncbi:N-acetyltransferase family protein [Rhizobium sp. LjRoot254]|uniref:GNAT family N-acetyltransferase n=1 Tax=Rhizobium sp. LjRoot254 TaxID=3342297 RepID=UPI003ED01DCD
MVSAFEIIDGPTMDIEIFDAERAARHLEHFADILRNAVHGGALVGYILPFELDAARAYWRGVIQSVADGERVLICALVGGDLAGTVQLYLSPEPNAPHRAEIYKLLVHPAHQRKGLGEALMRAAEKEALRHARTVLLLDTAQDSASERIYRRLGWQEIGVVPRHFVDPHGEPRSSVYMMRFLD